jgi:hypothetical protein
MNTAFVLVGLLTAAGAILTRGQRPRCRMATVRAALVAAGAGGVLVGLALADVNLAVHTRVRCCRCPARWRCCCWG